MYSETRPPMISTRGLKVPKKGVLFTGYTIPLEAEKTDIPPEVQRGLVVRTFSDYIGQVKPLRRFWPSEIIEDRPYRFLIIESSSQENGEPGKIFYVEPFRPIYPGENNSRYIVDPREVKIMRDAVIKRQDLQITNETIIKDFEHMKLLNEELLRQIKG